VKVKIALQLETMIMMFEREPALILVDFPQDESELFIENAKQDLSQKYLSCFDCNY